MKLRDLFMPVDSATLSDYDLCKAAPGHWEWWTVLQGVDQLLWKLSCDQIEEISLTCLPRFCKPQNTIHI